jgi:hypothetical protein
MSHQPLTIGDADVWVKTEDGEWSKLSAAQVTVQPEGVVTMLADGVRLCVPLWAVLMIEGAGDE